jgi:hypothetical protein
LELPKSFHDQCRKFEVFLLVLRILNCNPTLANTREQKKESVHFEQTFCRKNAENTPVEKKGKQNKSLKNFSAMYICYCSSRLQQLSKKKTQLKHNNSRSSSSSSSSG